MAASIGTVVPIHAQTPRVPRPVPGRTADAEPEVVGVAREWSGGLLGLAVEGNAFVLRFYTADKKPAPIGVPRAAVRWDPVGRSGTERVVLNPAEDLLRSPSVVRPPHVFVAWVTLFDPEGEVLGTLPFDLRELKAESSES